MKTLLPWLLSIALATLCLGLYVQVQHLKAAAGVLNSTTAPESADAPLQTQPETTQQTQTDPNELADLRKDRADLLRLRNEVRQLREQTKDIEHLKAQNTNLQNQLATSTAQVKVMQHAAEMAPTIPGASSATGSAPPPQTGMTGLGIRMPLRSGPAGHERME